MPRRGLVKRSRAWADGAGRRARPRRGTRRDPCETCCLGCRKGDLDAFLDALSPNALMSLPWLFEHWALAGHQLPPEGDWTTWVILGGRGAGKTRAGAEWVRREVEGGKPGDPGRCSRVALVGETLDQAREVMVFGSSGILACSPPDRRPEWQATRKRLVWPNGAVAQIFSASDPEALRGPQFDAAWCDELGKWTKAEERLGHAAVRAAAGRPAAGGGDDDAAAQSAAAGAGRGAGHGGDAGADRGEPDAPGGRVSRGGDGEVRRRGGRRGRSSTASSCWTLDGALWTWAIAGGGAAGAGAGSARPGGGGGRPAGDERRGLRRMRDHRGGRGAVRAAAGLDGRR